MNPATDLIHRSMDVMLRDLHSCLVFGVPMSVIRFFLVVVLFSMASTCQAQETVPAVQTGGLATIDWIIIAIYAAATIGLGWYYSRRQSTTEEYFVGSGNMHPALIGVSLFASLLSTISYLSIPGETIGKGPVYLANYIAYPFIFIVVGYFLMPVYMKYRVTSAYELLEKRLGVSIRLLGASMFLLLRLVWMSILTFLTSMAIAAMTGLPDSYIPVIIVVTGAVAITYASIGGLRAVVITDLMQTILLYGGALLTIGIVTWHMGGFGWFPTEWNDTWDTQPMFSFDPSVRVTLVGTFLSVFLWTVCTSGGDQVSVQRFMSTTDATAARRAVGIQLVVATIVGITLGLAGFALLGYFQSNPNAIPADFMVSIAGEQLTPSAALKANADQVFPRFIAFGLPPVVSGLVLSGLFAAAMSSIDSGVNSITAVVSSDFIGRLGRSSTGDQQNVRTARILAIAIGVTVVILGSLFSQLQNHDNITALTSKTVNLLTVPIFCLFFFALFVPFASTVGVWIGAVCGIITAVTVAFSGPLVLMMHSMWGVDPASFGTTLIETVNETTGETIRRCPDPISFQWISTLTLIVNVVTGSVASLIFPRSVKETPDSPATV